MYWKGLAKLTPHKSLDKKYFKYCLLVQKENITGHRNLGFSSISKREIQDIRLPLPPIDVQKNIVRLIEAVEGIEAKARETVSTAQKAIDNLIARCYQSDEPRRTIDSLSVRVQYGLSKAMNEDETGYKIFRMNEIIDGRMVDNGGMKYIDISPEEFLVYRLERGDLLFNRTNGSFDQVGKTGLFDLEGDYCCASYLVRITPGEDIKPKVLVAFMNSPFFLDEIRKQAVRSAGQNNINATKMKNMEVPVPSIGQQKIMLDKITILESQIATAMAELKSAPAMKRKILLDGIR